MMRQYTLTHKHNVKLHLRSEPLLGGVLRALLAAAESRDVFSFQSRVFANYTGTGVSDSARGLDLVCGATRSCHDLFATHHDRRKDIRREGRSRAAHRFSRCVAMALFRRIFLFYNPAGDWRHSNCPTLFSK